jgi:hypothetical protein
LDFGHSWPSAVPTGQGVQFRIRSNFSYRSLLDRSDGRTLSAEQIWDSWSLLASTFLMVIADFSIITTRRLVSIKSEIPGRRVRRRQKARIVCGRNDVESFCYYLTEQKAQKGTFVETALLQETTATDKASSRRQGRGLDRTLWSTLLIMHLTCKRDELAAISEWNCDMGECTRCSVLI